MKIISVVGARPQFVKIAPMAQAIERSNQSGGALIEHIIIHTGQHYDAGMNHWIFYCIKCDVEFTSDKQVEIVRTVALHSRTHEQVLLRRHE